MENGSSQCVGQMSFTIVLGSASDSTTNGVVKDCNGLQYSNPTEPTLKYLRAFVARARIWDSETLATAHFRASMPRRMFSSSRDAKQNKSIASHLRLGAP